MVITEKTNHIQLFEINDLHRTEYAEGDIVPIETIYGEDYDLDIPLIIPDRWSSYKHTSQDKYDEIFTKKYPIIKYVLENSTNIVVAGGAAASPLYCKDKFIFTDIDIFIYGLTGDIFWEMVNKITSMIITQSLLKCNKESGTSNIINTDIKVTQKIKRGIIIIGVYTYKTGQFTEYQIILREYKTLSSIIHAFDIPSCCIAYDGNIAYTTSLGAYAISRQVNLINTKYRSPSYEDRLIKYFGRGFGLCLPNLDKQKFKEVNHLYLTYISVYITHRKSDLIVISNEILNRRYNRYKKEEYSDIHIKSPNTHYEYILYIKDIVNKGIILDDTGLNRIIDYTEFHKYTVDDIISNFNLFMKGWYINNHINHILNSPIPMLKKIFISKEILYEVIDIIVNEPDSLKERIRKITMEQILLHANYVPEWVYRHDPGRQYTASINPLIEDPIDWYGEVLYLA